MRARLEPPAIKEKNLESEIETSIIICTAISTSTIKDKNLESEIETY